MEQYNQVYLVQPAERINPALSSLPVATEYDLHASVKGEPLYDTLKQGKVIPVTKRKALVVEGKVVSVMSDRYTTVQHEAAFRPIIEGLTMRGIRDFEFTLVANHRNAKLAVYVGEAIDGVKFGFRCINSFDGSSAINYGFKSYQKIESLQIVQKEHVLVWGYRQVCSNGMIARVPLKTCKYMDVEKSIKIKTLLQERARVLHVGDVNSKLEAVQYVVEAFTLLKGPLDMMIIDAKNRQLSAGEALELIVKYVGKRKKDKYMELYGREEQTLWGLFNCLTWAASHDNLQMSKRELLLNKAADLLEGELIVE